MSSNISAWTLWINMVFRRTSLIHRGSEFKRSWQWISAIWMAVSRKMFVRLGVQVCIITHSYSLLLSPSERCYTRTRCHVAQGSLIHAGLSATVEGECCNAEHPSRCFNDNCGSALHHASAMRRLCPLKTRLLPLGTSRLKARLLHFNTPNLSDAFGSNVSKQWCVLSLITAQWKRWEDFTLMYSSDFHTEPLPEHSSCNLHFQEYSGPKRNLGPRGADLVKETSPVSGQPEMGPWTLRKHIPHLKWGRKRLTTSSSCSLHLHEKILE